ncbi:MAG: Nif3-like dinuclear metal center hexameric protein [Planctomycetota bacterium]|jgi:putative NIF3 family GTP cyclohydrolase 1 type 2|nr:Nif3-like dinuclear metal center hexameric protein [Planctomycetota bacterium]
MLKPLPTVRDVIAVMEQIAPPALALARDPIGLQAGEVL